MVAPLAARCRKMPPVGPPLLDVDMQSLSGQERSFFSELDEGLELLRHDPFSQAKHLLDTVIRLLETPGASNIERILHAAHQVWLRQESVVDVAGVGQIKDKNLADALWRGVESAIRTRFESKQSEG